MMTTDNIKRLANNDGIATIIALFMMIMLTLIGIAAITISNDEITIAGNEMSEMASFYAAEAGLEFASAELQTFYEDSNKVPTIMPAGEHHIGDAVTVVYVTNDDGPAVQKQLINGSYSGLNAQVKTYTVSSIGTSLVQGSQMRLEQQFQMALIPIFQFAVFFMQDLWSTPAFDMNINGRTHVNGNMYLKSSTGRSLDFTDKLTCSGDIFHGFPYGDNNTGDVKFADRAGNLISMKQDGAWIDASLSDWYEQASTLWGGNVRDDAFGQRPLTLPLSGGDPHNIIERADGGNSDSYENKATLKIIDGVPFAVVGGIWQNVSALLPSGTIEVDNTTQFYDAHEKKWVRNTQIDMDKLKSSAYYPSNGIIYISDQSSTTGATGLNGTTLLNGGDIGRPLTVVCENPLYIQGDFNTTNKESIAAITDAITFLSNNWDPANSSLDYTSRPASATAVNISFITGDIAPQGTNYGGGLENLPRFLEDWDGREFKVRGSMIEGWRSEQAQGTWRYINASDAYYSAPMRNWGFDIDLEDPANLPPGTPKVQAFMRTGWVQKDVDISGVDDNYVYNDTMMIVN